MEKYYIYVSLEKITDSDIDKLLTSLSVSRDWTCPITSVTYSCYQGLNIAHPFTKTGDVTLLNRRSSSSNDLSSSLQIPKWMHVDKLNGEEIKPLLMKTFVNITEEVSRGPLVSKNVADQLHTIADTFRASGYTLDVIFNLGCKQRKIDDHIHLYGALKRFYDLYHANITILHQLSRDADLTWLNKWQKCLNARVLVAEDALPWLDKNETWRGSLILRESVDNTITMSNFLLKSIEENQNDDFNTALKDCGLADLIKSETSEPATLPRKLSYMSSCMEILASDVDVGTVPLHVYTGRKYQICIDETMTTCPESASFMEYMHQNTQKCCLVRLSRSQAPACGELLTTQTVPVRCRKTQKTATDIWKERLQTTQPEQLQDLALPGLKLDRTFLLRSNKSRVCIAYLLCQPQDIDSSAISKLVLPKRTRPINKENDDVRAFELPLIEGDLFKRFEEDIVKLQILVLREWRAHKQQQDPEATVTPVELDKILTGVRHGFYQQVVHMLPKQDLKPELSANATQSVCLLPEDVDAALNDSSTWLEKLCLSEIERRSKLPRLDEAPVMEKLSDKQSESSVALDAAEFLKMFLPNGESADTDLSPVKANRRSRYASKYDIACVDHVVDAPFEKAVHLKYHDVYYNTSDMCDRKDKVMKNMRERVSAEYSCTLDKNAPPVTFAMLAAQKSKARQQLKLMANRYGPVIESDNKRRASLKGDEHGRILRNSSQKNLIKGRPAELSAVPKHVKPLRRTMSASGVENMHHNKNIDIASPADSTHRDVTSSSPKSVDIGVKDSQMKEEVGLDLVDGPSPKMAKSTSSKAASKFTCAESKRRFQNNRKLLSSVCETVLSEHGITSTHPSFTASKAEMVKVVGLYSQRLKNSNSLEVEIRKMAETQIPTIKLLLELNS